VVCSFFGHSDASEQVYPVLRETIEELITKRGAINFLVGTHGNFDSMVLKALREAKTKYPDIIYNVVLAYMPAEKQEYELYHYSETLLPEGIETVPKRFAISWRNKWMVHKSQIVICYIIHNASGAAQFVQYAEHRGKETIRLDKS
jgi:uncharacterized phage-like protein YoqJ